MADTLTPEQRSKQMALVKSRDTNHYATGNNGLKLSDIGINAHQSARCQKLAEKSKAEHLVVDFNGGGFHS